MGELRPILIIFFLVIFPFHGTSDSMSITIQLGSIAFCLLLYFLFLNLQQQEIEDLISTVDFNNPNYITALKDVSQIYHEWLIYPFLLLCM